MYIITKKQIGDFMASERSRVLEVPTDLTREHSRFPDIPLLAQCKVMAERDGGFYDCYVPKELIDHEETPVREEWAQELADQMRRRSGETGEGTGQKTPIQLGWIEGETKLKIIDGFHRDAALVINGEEYIYATVELTDWNKLYDDRILLAKDHVHVRFSRVVKWIQEVWEHSDMSNELTVEQAILLYRHENTGSKLGLEPETVEKAKVWVAHKEKIWGIQAMTIHSHLTTAQNVDPLLVLSARDKKRSDVLAAPTQQIIKTLGKVLPDNFMLQNVAWQVARDNNLNAPKLKNVCELIKDCKSKEEAIFVLSQVDVSKIKPKFADTTNRQLRRAADPRHKGAEALGSATEEIDRVNRRVLASLERGESVDPEMSANLVSTIKHVNEMQTALGALRRNLEKLRGKTQIEQQATINPRSSEIEYARHKVLTVQNKDREPKPRNRTSIVHKELPNFGRFYQEDWGYFEPHIKFALALDHLDLTDETFSSLSEFIKQLLITSEIVAVQDIPDKDKEMFALIKPHTSRLGLYAPSEVGPIIKLDKDNNKIILTTKGIKYLNEVVKNGRIEIDDSHSEDSDNDTGSVL